MLLAYVYFDLVGQPYCGWEFRVGELLSENGYNVFMIPRHRCLTERKIPFPNGVDVIYCTNPMALDVAVKIKETIHKPLIAQFLDIPKGLFGSEEWRIREYERVRKFVEEADYITAISETTARDVQEWLGEGCPEIRVNYLGVDADLFQSFKPKNEGYICAVVRGLARQKQHNQILEALRKSKFKPPFKMIYGQYSDIQKAKVMSRCLFGVGMSTLEGFGLYVAELGFYNKPFVGRELPVFREIYDNSILYVDSVDGLAEKTDLLIGDLKLVERMGEKLRKTIFKKSLFLEAHVLRLQKILKEL